MRRLSSIFLLVASILFLSHFALATNLGFSEKLSQLIPKEARSNGKLGVVVKSLTTNENIFKYNSDRLFIPASNQKVIISVAALSLLAKDFRFKTVFYSGGEYSNGVIHGGLYIKGFGDPTLDTNDLSYIAQQIKNKGVKEIRGGIIVDDSYFESVRFGRGWKDRWKGDAFSPPVSALTLKYNTFEIKVSPTKLGSSPIISQEPQGASIKMINKAVTSNKRGSISAYWLKDDNAVIVNGRISPRIRSQSFELAVMNPALFTGSVLKKVLEDFGITVNGSVSEGVVPKWSTHIYTHNSVPLYLIVNEYNKESVNVIGENIMKTLGAHFMGAPGTWEKGARVISDFLIGIGISANFKIVDGSGLSLLNRVTPQTLTDVLEYAYSSSLIGREFMKSLPIAGVDGTLKKRFRRSLLEGRVFAKTGYLNDVRALSGYAVTKTGDVLAFSILSNGVGPEVKTFQSKMLTELMDCCSSNGIRGN